MNSTERLYIAGIIGVILILVIGFVIVRQHTPMTPTGQVNDLGTSANPAYYDTTGSTRDAHTTPVSTPHSPDLQLFSYNPSAPASIAGHIINSDSSFDFHSFMQEIANPSSQTSPFNQTPAAQNYTYAITMPISPGSSASARTDIQQALYLYGNTAGTYIKNYEQANPHDVATIQTYFDNRASAASATSLKQLAADLGAIGTNLKKVADVPAPIATTHEALADSYIDMGTKLAALPEAQSNGDTVKAVLTYDSAVDTYVRAYNALALAFETYGVSFGTSDSGSVFTFTNVAGL